MVVLEEPPAEVFPEEQEVKEKVTKVPEEPVEKPLEEERRESRPREHRKSKKAPPKKLQKLHNLTGDLLFQVGKSLLSICGFYFFLSLRLLFCLYENQFEVLIKCRISYGMHYMFSIINLSILVALFRRSFRYITSSIF